MVRMQAAELFEQQVKPSEVARRLRVSVKSAYQWHQLCRDGGVQALASRGPSGSRCRLSPRCLEKLAGFLEEGPAAHGWVEDQVWTASRVVTLIGRKFHISVCPEHEKELVVGTASNHGAVWKMKVFGPSESPYGGRLQTASCCVS
ncbi:transposase [Streptomyces sp. NPDC058290]|uniref:helix-turn-helix domain-containing protein n=1 Tax=Streptomyces sp. NPDC058290 TaxID=3346426 RepID=UPI0036E814D5